MASFYIAVDSSVMLNRGNHHRPMIPKLSYMYMARKYIADLRTSGFSRLSMQWRGRTVRVKAKGNEDESDDQSEDAVEATIEKSKKILAMQKDLLKQIAERKKLVSSIKESIIDPEDPEVPYRESKGTSSALDIAADGGREGNENGSLSTSSANKEEDDMSAKYFDTNRKEPGKDLARNGASSSAIPREPSKATTFGTIKTPGVLDIPFQSSFKQLENDTKTTISGSRITTEVDSGKKLKDRTTQSEGVISVPSRSTVLEKRRETLFSGSNASAKVESGLQDTNVEVQGPASEDAKPPPLAGPNVMNVILVAAECAPWCKTGGLGDVAGALPKALARRGHRVMVVVPRYGEYPEPQDTGVRKRYKVDGQDFEVSYFHAFIDGVDFVFVETPMFRHLGNSNIYGGNRPDILKRMVLFCKAAVEVPWHVPCGGICYGDGNLVFIANDWHTALLPVYLKAYYRDNGLMKYTRSVLVIHNIAHQGRGPVDDFSFVDLPPHYLDLFKLYDPVGGEHFNIFAAGLKTADRIVTVSHGYAWELKTSEGGWGLHGIINENDWKFRGIVNGIDTKEWNPELDVHLKSDGYVNYSLDTLQTGKPQCKTALQRELGLPVREDVPLIGFIGRLDHQKGVDLIAEAVPWMMGQDVQLVMLGTGRPDLEDMLRHFEGQYRDKVRGWVGFSVKMAHRITAGVDILLMPSRFEPCGLNQLYAMSYGTIPVVHAVGGLRDTVHPFNPFEESGLGWTFSRAEANELINALGNCLLTYRQYKQSWEGLQRRGMTQDLSWDNAAQNYEEVLVAAKYQW